ncbi:MAG: hypothetical protein WC570_02980 [Patescibacteria group bacterium]
MEEFTSLTSEKKTNNNMVLVIAGVGLALILILVLAVWAIVHTVQNLVPEIGEEVVGEVELAQLRQQDDQIEAVADDLVTAINTYYTINGFYPPDNHVEYLWSGNRIVMDGEPVLPEECGEINLATELCGINYMTMSGNQGFVLDVRYLARESQIIKQDEGADSNIDNKTNNNSSSGMSSGNVAPKISPVLFDSLSGYPGETLSLKQTISNPTGEIMVLEVATQDFLPRAGDTAGVPELTTKETEYSLYKWISYEQNKLTIEPGKIVDFDFQINIPANAKAGGHYASLMFETGGEASGDSDQLSVRSGVGSLLLLKVLGDDLVESGYVKNITVDDENKIYAYIMEIEFINEGNVHIHPTGTMAIYDTDNELVEKIPVNGENVLPESLRVFNVEWQPNKNITSLKGYHLEVTGKYGDSGQSFNYEQDL